MWLWESILYNRDDIINLKFEAMEFSLIADPCFWHESTDTLIRICNGVGPEQMNTLIRKALTAIYHRYQPAAMLHDYDYEVKAITKAEADKRFLENMLKIWKVKFGWRRFFLIGIKDRLKIRAAYIAVKNFGSDAWEAKSESC